MNLINSQIIQLISYGLLVMIIMTSKVLQKPPLEIFGEGSCWVLSTCGIIFQTSIFIGGEDYSEWTQLYHTCIAPSPHLYHVRIVAKPELDLQIMDWTVASLHHTCNTIAPHLHSTWLHLHSTLKSPELHLYLNRT